MRKEKYAKLTEKQKVKERESCLKRYYKKREELMRKNRKWKLDNKEKVIEYKISYYLNNIYNITIEDYNKMFNEQKGCCKICNIHQSNLNKRLSVDHCHITNIVRGLLCNNCNLAIGNMKDNTENLKKAIEYLENAKKTIEVISPDQAKIILR